MGNRTVVCRSSASPAIVLIQGAPLATQLAAVIARLESTWNQLCPTLPVWRQEAVPTREIDSSRALLNGWRSRPAPQSADLSPWHPLRTRFANGVARFINRPSPSAVPAPLPRPQPRWVYRETGIDWFTLSAVPALDARVWAGCRPGHWTEMASTPDGATRIALQQTIRDIVPGDPAFQCPTPATLVRHGGGPPLDSVVMAA